MSTFISYERVRAGQHFPTDVIMGALVGAGIGVLVPHLHRRRQTQEQERETPPVLVGFAPLPGSGGSLTITARF